MIKFAIVSTYNKKNYEPFCTNDSEVWLFDTESEAKEALEELTRLSVKAASRDDNLQYDRFEFINPSWSRVIWQGGFQREFAVVKVNSRLTI